MYSEDDLLPISGLQHLEFCERQWALIYLEQAWAENQLTAEGRVLHERCDGAEYAPKFRNCSLIDLCMPEALGRHGGRWRARRNREGDSMYTRILKRMQSLVRDGCYAMTLHAHEEMEDDRLTIRHVLSVVLAGHIVERQKDAVTGEWKYRLRAKVSDGRMTEIVAKIGPTGKVFIITVYVVEE